MTGLRNGLRRFSQFGGWRLVWQYAKMGVLGQGVKALFHCALHGQPLKWAYPKITQKVDKFLLARYQYVLDEALSKLDDAKDDCLDEEMQDSHGQRNVPKVVWFSWLQGIEQAPDIVQVCLQSQMKYLPGYEFRVIDLENYQKWISLPQYVVDKFRKELIPPALFSDLLRLSLLKEYGGIWMDASVYCSGFGNEKLRER